MTDYYELDLDDMVIALNNKDIDIELLQKKLDIALDTLGQIAKFSTNSTDAVQCAVAIQQINEIEEVQ